MNLKKYHEIAKENEKKEPLLLDSILAFFSGGIIGLISQGLIDLYQKLLNLDFDHASALMSISIVFVTSLLTLFGLYKYLGRICGAGLFLPTTGFANSITSSCIEARHEGFILGIGSQMFSLAGSVITYGVVFSFLFLIIKFFMVLGSLK